MAVIKCKMCGGTLEFSGNETVAVCEYCGSKQTVPMTDDEKKIGLFTRANKLRSACNFDKAANVYETIVNDFPEEAEAYWGLILCNYGIEYVDDPATGKKIPTCHRSSFDSVMDSSDFEMVMENADPVARKVYREEAKVIEEIRRSIVEVSSKEEPYDIFICYKETDDFGDRTLDSVIAQDVYNELTDKGYRVFFSRITLEDKLGVEYEPYIFAALNSAKIMLVFGTDYEFFNAVWVKNEWSRYLKLMASDKTKHLIPCYKGVDAYDMPKEFARLQSQDMGKVGATQDLLRGIEKLFAKKKAPTADEISAVQQTTSNPSVDSYLKRAYIFLEDGDWKSADEYCEKVLDIDPENAQAYLGKLMAELKVRKQEALNNLDEPFDERNNYLKVKRYGNESLIQMLDSYIDVIKKRKEERIKKELEAQLKKEQEERARKEQKQLAFRQKLKKAQLSSGLISTNFRHTVAVKSDGTVLATGYNEYNQCHTSNWSNIVAVAAGDYHTLGLKKDGTVVAVGDNDAGQCNVDRWSDIVSIAAGSYHTIGLKSNGTVVATGSDGSGRCNVGNWTNIVAIATSDSHTVGLRSDGTVVATGNNSDGQCNVGDWSNIVAVSAGVYHTVGLKSDGTVVAVGDNTDGQCRVSAWSDIIAVAAGGHHTAGVRTDGTVMAVGENTDGQCNVSNWTDVFAVSLGNFHTVGLKLNGTIVATGYNSYSQCDLSDWRLFESIDSLDSERREKMDKTDAVIRERIKMQNLWRQRGLCQHCGGEFKGLILRKCSVCDKHKDY